MNTNPTRTEVEALRFDLVTLDQPPLDYRYGPGCVPDEGFLDEEYIITEYATLPKPFAQALDRVTAAKDSCRCLGCSTPIGYVLREDDTTGRHWMPWITAVLVREGTGPVVAVCEDCVPALPEVPAR